MIEGIAFWLATVSLALIALLLIVVLYKVLTSEDNTLACWQFIATKNREGKYVADLDKLGKLVGIFVGSWIVVKVAYDGKMDFALLGTYFAFVGGIAGYSAYLRSRQKEPPHEPTGQVRHPD